MKLSKRSALAAVFGVSTMVSQAVVIDDFSGDLSNYTSTLILNADGGGTNTANWQISGGALQFNTTAVASNAEQYAMIYNGLSLGVGQELRVDVSHTTASQDIGLYVGGTTPVTGVRNDYVAVYARGDGALYSRGWDGTSTEYGLAAAGVVSYDKLFIARTAANTYETGYYDGATRNVITTRTPSFANDGDVVGFYADVRAVGVLGNLDNLEVIPEPTVAVLGAFGLVGLMRRRRA